MKVLLVLGHPNPGSFNHALAGVVKETLVERGHEVRVHDLYAEQFNPLMGAGELGRGEVLPSEIEDHCRELEEADGLVIVHPNWWSAPPAVLRGWVDRVFRPGRAYQFVPDGSGGAKPVGLLRLRSALVLNTANTPQELEERLYGDPLQAHWMRVVFGICGVPHAVRRSFSPVIGSTAETRNGWLEETRMLAKNMDKRMTEPTVTD